MPEGLRISAQVALADLFLLEPDSVLLIVLRSGELLLVEVLLESCCHILLLSAGRRSVQWTVLGVLAGAMRLCRRADAIVGTRVLRTTTDGAIVLVCASSLHVVEPAVAQGHLDRVVGGSTRVGPASRREEGVLLKLLLLLGEFALRDRGGILSRGEIML